MNDLEKMIETEMNRGADDSDPYWKLFKCKEAVNDALVESYKLGLKTAFSHLMPIVEKQYEILDQISVSEHTTINFLAKSNLDWVNTELKKLKGLK